MCWFQTLFLWTYIAVNKGGEEKHYDNAPLNHHPELAIKQLLPFQRREAYERYLFHGEISFFK